MQHCSFGNLENLIKNIGGIPEDILRQITYRIFKSLETFSLKTGETFGCLSPNNICFDSKCNVKVSFIILIF